MPTPAPLVVVPAPRRAPEPPAVRERTENDERREAELIRLAGQLADKERRLREKDETIADLRQQLQKAGKQLRTAVRDADTPAAVPAVYADPERQFRYEVEQLWLRSVPETERDEHPLASYRLGRDWVASDGDDRARRPPENPRRDSGGPQRPGRRQHRPAPAPDAHQRRRR